VGFTRHSQGTQSKIQIPYAVSVCETVAEFKLGLTMALRRLRGAATVAVGTSRDTVAVGCRLWLGLCAGLLGFTWLVGAAEGRLIDPCSNKQELRLGFKIWLDNGASEGFNNGNNRGLLVAVEGG